MKLTYAIVLYRFCEELTLSLPYAIIRGFCKLRRSRWDGSMSRLIRIYAASHSLLTLHINVFPIDSLFKKTRRTTNVVRHLAPKELRVRILRINTEYSDVCPAKTGEPAYSRSLMSLPVDSQGFHWKFLRCLRDVAFFTISREPLRKHAYVILTALNSTFIQ